MNNGDDERIPLHVSNKTAFVWSVDGNGIAEVIRDFTEFIGFKRRLHAAGHAPHLRRTYRHTPPCIPTKCFPRSSINVAPRGSGFAIEQRLASLVFAIFRRSDYLLSGIACIVDDIESHTNPTPEQLLQWNAHRQKVLSTLPAKAPPSIPPTLNDEALRKRLERQKKKEEQMKAKEESGDANVPAQSASSTQTKNTKEQSYSFTIPAESEFAWYKTKKYLTIEEARIAGIWSYPSTPEEAARCHIFEDLWKQGYYIGNGLRFGGHWLVYPGEPLRYS